MASLWLVGMWLWLVEGVGTMLNGWLLRSDGIALVSMDVAMVSRGCGSGY